MTASLSFVGLTRTHPGAASPAVADLDLVVAAGSCVALLGPSGSGKTSVLRLAAGLDAPDSGAVLVDGRPVTHLPPERRGLAMASQRPLLFPHLTVLDNVAFAPRVAGAGKRTARARAAEFLELVGMGGLGHRSARTLSGGQAQRVALARTLAAEPAVLLLDEPFSALDPEHRTQMHQLLLDIRTQLRPTILLVTHDQHEAARLADSIAVLIDGRLLAQAPAGQLYSRPPSLTVSRFLGGRNEVPGQMVAGVHVSALGRLDVAAPAVTDGPAVLVARHEAIAVVDPDDPTRTADGPVLRLVASGARDLIEVSTPGGILSAEVPAGSVGVGCRVGLRLPPTARAVVAAPRGASPLVAGTRVDPGVREGAPEVPVPSGNVAGSVAGSAR